MGRGLWRRQHHPRQRGARIATRDGARLRLCRRRRLPLSPDTMAGFALAGGGTNFSVNGLGTGRSDLFQAGAFVRHNVGAAYVSGAARLWLAGRHHRSHRDGRRRRSLRAEFNANALSGRVEGGYRFVTPWMGIHALCRRAVHHLQPAGLCRAGAVRRRHLRAELCRQGRHRRRAPNSAFAPTSPLRCRTAILTLRGRAAWAHDFDPDRNDRRGVPDAAGRIASSSTARRRRTTPR